MCVCVCVCVGGGGVSVCGCVGAWVVCGRVGVCGDVSLVTGCVSYALHSLIVGKCYASTKTHRLYNESVHRKKQHTRGNNTIP